MANIFGGQSSWLWDDAGKKSKKAGGGVKTNDMEMLTPGLLKGKELKARLKGLSHEERQVILQEQELYRARGRIRRQDRLKEFVKMSGFKDLPRGRGRISATYQFVQALLDLLNKHELNRLASFLAHGGVSQQTVKRPKYTKEDKSTILRMAAEGRRDREIADAINRPLPSVTRKRKQLQADQASSHSASSDMASRS